jgi:dTDP-4-amino-4,6-dideoxygalactose transaminase
MKTAYSKALKEVEGRVCPWQSVTPPNRLEATNRELLLGLYTSRGGDPREALLEALRRITGRRHVFLAPSGRAAIAKILSVLPSHEVVMPAYTCPVVKTAAEVAGKRIIYVDCSAESLNATSAEFQAEARPGRVLLPTHLFGIPTDVDRICALAKERGCVTIEDAAASFPAWPDGRLLGTVADFGVFSFERSKRLPAFRGAAIVVNNEGVVDPKVFESHFTVPMENGLPVRELLLSLIYNMATQPWVYGRFTVHRILKGHRSTLDSETTQPIAAALNTPFFNHSFHAYQADLVLRALNRWDALGRHIEQLVAVYKRTFASTAVRTFVDGACDEKALLRFPIIIPGNERDETLRRALKCGLYLETNYESPLAPKSGHAKYPNAFRAADNVVLLPLYRRLSLEAAETIARKVVRICEEARGAGND